VTRRTILLHNLQIGAGVFTRCTRGGAVTNLACVKSLASVLIAEEDRSVVSQLQAAFQKSSPEWPVLAVDNGEHALAYLRGKARLGSVVKFPVTTVFLLSLTIGQVTAFQILDWIKRQRALRSVVIALLCGAGEMREVDRTLKYGAYAVLNKPILSWQIAALVGAVETGSPGSAQLAVSAELQIGELLSIVPGGSIPGSPELAGAGAPLVRDVALLTSNPPLSG
jgi:CheY-like chemotaxis protein